MLKVAVEATALIGRRSGVGEYTQRLLEGLPDAGVEVAAFPISLRRRGALRGLLPDRVAPLELPLAARPLRWGWTHLGRPRLDALFSGFDVIHGTNFVVPPAKRIGTVVTVHDLTPLLFPEYCEPAVLDYPVLVKRALGAGTFVITPSHFVREQVLDRFGADPDRVVAIWEGPLEPAGQPEASRPSWAEGRFLASLSTLEPRKGVVDLLAAFERVAAEVDGVRLVIAGRRGWGLEEFDRALAGSAVRDRVVLPGYVTPAERRWLLENAEAFVLASHYEGFGLPLLEAMAYRCPVIATTAGALPEVAGDAAVLVDPRDPEGLAAAIVKVLADPEGATAMVARGERRLARFSWAEMARRTAAVYAMAALR